MRSVFRLQGVETQLVIAVSCVVLIQPMVRVWQQTSSSDSAPAWWVVIACVVVTAHLLFVRALLAVCRGGSHLWGPRFGAGLGVLGLAPSLWTDVNPVLPLALAALIMHCPMRRALIWITVELAVATVLMAARGALAAAGGVLLETALLTFVAVSVSRLLILLDGLYVAREQMARRRVDMERERISRDLHDLMGRTLVAASLRNQTALRLVRDGDAQLAGRLEHLHNLLSQGQQQLRALTTGAAIARLADEIMNLRMLAERLGIELTVQVGTKPPPQHDGVVGLIVRENITNVLRHSRASYCVIVIDSGPAGTTVSMVNDRVLAAEAIVADLDSNTRLNAALQLVSGSSSAAVDASGRFEFAAHMPRPSTEDAA